MSETAPTFIVAQIHVTSGDATPAVTYTSRVRSGFGVVIWFVHNDTGDELDNVKVGHFTPAANGIGALGILSGSFADLNTGPIPDGHKAILPGVFVGRPGDVYNYEIEVDGRLAADPQLEI
jgi:hypothetical protein